KMLPDNTHSKRLSANAPARTSMNGLLPSPVVCSDDPGLSNMFENGRVKRMVTSFSNIDLKCNGSSTLERSSDSEDSRSGSGATSGKEASPGYAESSGSEQSSGAPLSDEAHVDETEPNVSSSSSMSRSHTTPALNGEWGLDDALKSLTQISTDINVAPPNADVRHNNSLNRIRAAHEMNVSKLAYLEALFQRTKIEESQLGSVSLNTSIAAKRTAPDGRLAERRITDETPVSSYSPDSGYKSSPTTKERKMKTSTSGPCLSSISKVDDQSMIDGQTLLRTIESRLQRSQETNNSQRQLYKTGGSASAGSLSRLSCPPGNAASTPVSRYTSPSRPPNLPSINSAPVTKRPDGLGRLPAGYHGEHSLPHHYRSRSAYSSPAVSPQRGPDPFLLTSPSEVTVTRRFSSLDTRSRSDQHSSSRHLPIRHTAHGFPSASLPLSPPSPAQGASALQKKMNLFLEIMDTQWKFSK
ncbi:hypothetical protein FHG87_001223, partial [Trinorchestia longiramus]